MNYPMLGAMLLSSAVVLAQPAHPYAVARPLAEPALFAEGVISTPDYELNAAFTPDGRTIYFTKSTANLGYWTIVVSHFREGTWTTPEVASFSGQHSDADPFVSPDGKTKATRWSRPTRAS